MGVNTASGARFFIGTEDADNSVDTLLEYQAEVFTEVGEVEDMGEIGDAWNFQTFTAMADSRVRRFKTTKDGGEVNVIIGFDTGDAGQTAIETAFDSKNNYTFKIELDDSGGANPTTWFFRAMVGSNRIPIGSNDTVVRRNVTIAINSDLIRLAAA